MLFILEEVVFAVAFSATAVASAEFIMRLLEAIGRF
jgi:hypothetical protein